MIDYINELKKLNDKAIINNDVPVSCIIVYKNKIISKAYNKREYKNNPLLHAEIIAIQKAVADARKNLITVPLFNSTIPHTITGKSGAGSVKLRPASKGTGVIAGGAVRAVLELSGVENILSKSLGSKSPLNAANATLNALKSLRQFKDVASVRKISVKEMLGQK